MCAFTQIRQNRETFPERAQSGPCRASRGPQTRESQKCLAPRKPKIPREPTMSLPPCLSLRSTEAQPLRGANQRQSSRPATSSSARGFTLSSAPRDNAALPAIDAPVSRGALGRNLCTILPFFTFPVRNLPNLHSPLSRISQFRRRRRT